MILYEWKEGQPDRLPETEEEQSAFGCCVEICYSDAQQYGSTYHLRCTRPRGHPGLHVAAGMPAIVGIWNEEVKPKDSAA